MSAAEPAVVQTLASRAAGRATRRVLIVGAGALARSIEAEIAARPRSSYRVTGRVAELPRDSGIGTVLRHRPHCIVVAVEGGRDALPMEPLLASRLSGIAVEDGVQFYEQLTGKCAIEFIPTADLIFCRELWSWRFDAALSRALSIVLALVGLVGLAPVFAAIALGIKLTSRGPVFFRQPRMGLDSRPFSLVKFRTMRPVDREPSQWAADNAERITGLGNILRRFRLDEIPQFWNVLCGDMNLVGPRPHPVANHKLFLQRIPHYALRARVRPGITGWAQVRYGYANNLEEETEKMRYDLYYIKHLSLALDLRILVDTLKVVLLGRGSLPLEPRNTGPQERPPLRPPQDDAQPERLVAAGR